MRDGVAGSGGPVSLALIVKSCLCRMGAKSVSCIEDCVRARVPVGKLEQPFSVTPILRAQGTLLLFSVPFTDARLDCMRLVGLSTLCTSRINGLDQGFVPKRSADTLVWELSIAVTIVDCNELARQVYRDMECRLPHVSALVQLQRKMANS